MKRKKKPSSEGLNIQCFLFGDSETIGDFRFGVKCS